MINCSKTLPTNLTHLHLVSPTQEAYYDPSMVREKTKLLLRCFKKGTHTALSFYIVLTLLFSWFPLQPPVTKGLILHCKAITERIHKAFRDQNKYK